MFFVWKGLKMMESIVDYFPNVKVQLYVWVLSKKY